jgi:demethylmenaquinone methyltransferase/2-methoxy-6-polyprenyl-1,4-benzoquinol methylase
MLEEARKRPGADRAQWRQGSAAGLPFPDGRFDAVVSAYVMRNLYKGGLLEESLREAFRTLKAGGRLMFLDLTRPGNAAVRWGHGLYLKTLLPLIGRIVCGPAWPGSYLRTSIEDLPPEPALRDAFQAAGFKDFKIVPLTGGIVSLFIAQKC